MTTADQATPHSLQSAFNFSPDPSLDAEFVKKLEFIPGLKELVMLRQVHALEHATVWVLSETQTSATSPPFSRTLVDNELLGGMSTESGFYLYGDFSTTQLQRAVKTALRRIIGGEWDLAVHPRCGTNVSVGMLLTAGFALGIHLIFPRGPIEQLIGFGLAASTAAQLAPDLGQLAQRYVTTAIPFNLAVENISQTRDIWGRTAHFVRIRWQNS